MIACNRIKFWSSKLEGQWMMSFDILLFLFLLISFFIWIWEELLDESFEVSEKFLQEIFKRVLKTLTVYNI